MLRVEDGSGMPDAEAYASVEFVRNFCEDWGLPIQDTVSEADFESGVRRGTVLFDTMYRDRFPGFPVNSSQALAFPMTGLMDRRGYLLPLLPLQVKQAAALLSRQEIVEPMSMYPTVVRGGRYKRRVKVEGIEVEYGQPTEGVTVEGSRPVLPLVESVLSAIITMQSGGKILFGSSARG